MHDFKLILEKLDTLTTPLRLLNQKVRILTNHPVPAFEFYKYLKYTTINNSLKSVSQ